MRRHLLAFYKVTKYRDNAPLSQDQMLLPLQHFSINILSVSNISFLLTKQSLK